MKPVSIRPLAAAAALTVLGAASPAHAELVDVRLTGFVSRVNTFYVPPDGSMPGFVEVPSLGVFDKGDQFVLNLLLDTTANAGLSADFVLAGGGHYSSRRIGEGWGIWNPDFEVFYLGSETEYPTHFGGLTLRSPLLPQLPIDEQRQLRDVVEVLRTHPEGVTGDSTLFACWGDWTRCAGGGVHIAITGATVTAVPETSSLAMMLAGIAGLGLLARRR